MVDRDDQRVCSVVGEDGNLSRPAGAPRETDAMWKVALALFSMEGATALVLLALYKRGDQPLGAFLSTTAGLFMIGAGIVALVSVCYLGWCYARATSNRRKPYHLTVAMNLVTLCFVVVSSELAIRMLATETREGAAINGMLLLPKDWGLVSSRNLQIWDRASGDLVYMIYDPLLGWKVGPNRKSADGLYFSDEQGLRTAQTGKTVEASASQRVVALLGDSFTFGEEVAFEETWGVQLERLLGQGVRVQNYGVPGYGIDQMYLRYIHEVADRKPDVLIFSFIAHDMLRSMMVYNFLSLPEWDMPFSKPRFIMTDRELKAVNVPSLTPPMIFGTERVGDLPHLDLELGYSAAEWDTFIYHRSYLVRFALSRFPRWVEKNHNGTEEAVLELNRQIVKEFLRRASAAGSKALVVYFPTSEDLDVPPKQLAVWAKHFLVEVGLPILDLTPCLAAIPAGDRFSQEPGRGGHFSPRGNAAVAQCLSAEVQKLLAAPVSQKIHGRV